MDRAGSVRRGKVADLENLHKRLVHLERIKKIKNRKPGSSGTLDNTPPEVIPAMYVNPRKEAKKKEFNRTTEQENKCLLQRISKILTAPPLITDADYQKQKLLCPSTKGLREKYEQDIIDKRHAEFMHHLKTIGSYYKPKDWENDYRKQVQNQKFMRQVNYHRPKDFVDIFAPVNSNDNNSSSRNSPYNNSLSRGSGSGSVSATVPKSAAHIHRIKCFQLKQQRQDIDGKRNESADDASKQSSSYVNGKIPEGNDIQEKRVELAKALRNISIERDGIISDLHGEVVCYLIQDNVLLITSVILCNDEVNTAEAEIGLYDYLEMKCLPEEAATDIEQLQEIARGITEGVEMKIEEGVARIVLKMIDNSDAVDEYENDYTDSGAVHSNDITVRKGVVVTLHIHKTIQTNMHVSKLSKRVTTTHLLPPRYERVSAFATAKFNLLDIDRATVTLFFISSSFNRHESDKTKRVLMNNTSIATVVGLPSIMCSDPSTTRDYLATVLEDLVVIHDSNTGDVKLHLNSYLEDNDNHKDAAVGNSHKHK